MRRIAAVFVLGALVGLALAACGSDYGNGDGGSGGGGGKPGGDAGARAFIECFKAPGYKAVNPKAGQESLFALESERRGFPNTPVNVVQGQEVVASVFLVFFESEDKAKEALDEIGRTTVGDIPPQQRGPAVLAYTGEEDKRKTEKSVNACL
jgi:hypothetical protein